MYRVLCFLVLALGASGVSAQEPPEEVEVEVEVETEVEVGETEAEKPKCTVSVDKLHADFTKDTCAGKLTADDALTVLAHHSGKITPAEDVTLTATVKKYIEGLPVASAAATVQAIADALARNRALEYLSWKQAVLLKELSDAGAMSLSAGVLARVDPKRFGSLDESTQSEVTRRVSAYIGDLELSSISAEDLASLSPDYVRFMSIKKVADITPAAFAQMTKEQLKKLTKSQVARLSEGQLDSLSDVKRAVVPSTRYLRLRHAMKPGLRLMGDGYAQLEKTGAAGSGFGIGLEFVYFSKKTKSIWLSSVVVRKGSEAETISGSREFGDFLLSPGDSNLYTGIDVAMLTGGGFFQGWYFSDCTSNPEQLYCQGILMSGVRMVTQLSQAEWALDESGGVTPVARVTMLDVALGPTWNVVLAQGDNHAAISLMVGPNVRYVSYDVFEDQANPESDFANRATNGGTNTTHVGVDARLELRINNVVVGVRASVMPKNIIGFSGLQFVPSITLRTGAQLIDFAR